MHLCKSHTDTQTSKRERDGRRRAEREGAMEIREKKEMAVRTAWHCHLHI